MPVLSERFSMSATSQYYSYLDDIDRVRSFFQQKFCSKDGKSYCLDTIDGFARSDYIDVDYDTISRSVVLTAESSNAGSTNEGWTETIRLPSKEATVEIGVLSLEGNADPEDVQFGGFLTVLGQDDKPSTYIAPTTLSSRHHDSKKLTTHRTHALPNPNPALPSPPSFQEPNGTTQTPPPNLQHLLQPTNRPPPNPHPNLPSTPPHPTRPLLQTTHPPNPPLLPLHRQVPILRRPVPRRQEPKASPQYSRGYRSRSPRLGCAGLGLRGAL